MTATLHRRSSPRPLLPVAFGPNWFASVMGTGIVANAAATLPLQFPGLRVAATTVWVIAAAWLVTLCVTLARRRSADMAALRDPALAQFWGCPPMALLTVGAGTVALGRDVVGLDVALGVGWVLWTAGTALGLVTTIAVPLRMMTGQLPANGPVATWLLPVVAPMVSASTGAALIAHLPAGQFRLGMVIACYALFGVSLFATLAILPQVWQALIRHGIGPAVSVPTLFVVLGPLGQSATAANLLGDVAPGVLPAPYGTAAHALGLLYGVPALGFALMWLTLAILVTARTRPPFTMAWWSFTFPIGTCVTAVSAMATHTGSAFLGATAVALYVLLVGTWLTVARKTGSRRA